MSKVLLIEDELSLRELYAEVLRDEGYEVEEVSEGDVALERIQSGEWDILLLDLMLPKLDGLQVLKKIGSDPLFSVKPVIVMSNLIDAAIIAECKKLGAKEFLIKANSDPSDIVRVVGKYISNEQS